MAALFIQKEGKMTCVGRWIENKGFYSETCWFSAWYWAGPCLHNIIRAMLKFNGFHVWLGSCQKLLILALINT